MCTGTHNKMNRFPFSKLLFIVSRQNFGSRCRQGQHLGMGTGYCEQCTYSKVKLFHKQHCLVPSVWKADKTHLLTQAATFLTWVFCESQRTRSKRRRLLLFTDWYK